eukprot:1887243-Pleurochrysis_carterae.AAC.1
MGSAASSAAECKLWMQRARRSQQKGEHRNLKERGEGASVRTQPTKSSVANAQHMARVRRAP